jgi:hypothetical protein
MIRWLDTEDAEAAKKIVLGAYRLSARDAIHVAGMRRRGVAHILTFDAGYEGVPGVSRLASEQDAGPHDCQRSPTAFASRRAGRSRDASRADPAMLHQSTGCAREVLAAPDAERLLFRRLLRPWLEDGTAHRASGFLAHPAEGTRVCCFRRLVLGQGAEPPRSAGRRQGASPGAARLPPLGRKLRRAPHEHGSARELAHQRRKRPSSGAGVAPRAKWKLLANAIGGRTSCHRRPSASVRRPPAEARSP